MNGFIEENIKTKYIADLEREQGQNLTLNLRFIYANYYLNVSADTKKSYDLIMPYSTGQKSDKLTLCQLVRQKAE